MTRRRWIADEVSGNCAALTGEHADHLARVLRARMGQEFDISARGTVRPGRITSISDGRVEFELGDAVPRATGRNITLVLSIFKFDRMEWAIEKCTELGASTIVPVVAQRTDAHLAGAATKRVDRWRRLGLQAAEQSRRGSPPEISTPLKLKEALGLQGGLRVVLSETEHDISLAEVLGAESDDGDVVLAIGPEGGWTEMELKAFRESGWKSASLGNTVLRAETAAIAALVLTTSTLAG